MKETGLQPFGLNKMKQFNVNREGAVEAVWNPLYHFQNYAAAGQTSLTFFQVAEGSSGLTLADTNMTNGGTLPAPQEFLITSISIAFYPAASPGRFSVATAATNWNDVYAVAKSGYLKLRIGSKDYTVDAPLGKFPPRFWVGGTAALSGNNADAATNSMVDYATFAGPLYEIVPYRLIPTQNFNVSLNWPTAVTITAQSRIGVILGGFLYRLSQ